MILSFLGLGALPLNVGGLILIVFGLVLFGLELTVTSHGLLGFGGIVCIALGAAALYTEPGDPFAPVLRRGAGRHRHGHDHRVAVHRADRPGRRPDATDGRAWRARRPADHVRDARRRPEPAGAARLGLHLGGEEWSARSADDRPIDRGTPVTVVAVDGLTVLVEPAFAAVPAPSPTNRRIHGNHRPRRVRGDHRRHPADDPVPLGPRRSAVREDGRIPAGADQ